MNITKYSWEWDKDTGNSFFDKGQEEMIIKRVNIMNDKSIEGIRHITLDKLSKSISKKRSMPTLPTSPVCCSPKILPKPLIPMSLSASWKPWPSSRHSSRAESLSYRWKRNYLNNLNFEFKAHKQKRYKDVFTKVATDEIEKATHQRLIRQ